MVKLFVNILRVFFHERIRLFHLYAFLKYNSFKKFFNFILNEWERKIKKTKLKSFPYIFDFESTNMCNYRCPFCFTGKRMAKKYGKLDLDNLKKVLDQFGDYIIMATPHGWGEALMNKDIYKIISFLHQYHIYSVLSTNVSLLTEEVAKKIIKAKLNYLILAIDGTTQKSYEKYRRGGNYKKVIKNARTFIEIKKQMKSSLPYVEWQFAVFDHNKHQINEAKKLAKEIGVNSIRFIQGYVEDNAYAVDDPKYQSRFSPLRKRSECKFLWNSLTVKWNGEIVPCCWDDYGHDKFGNLFKSNIKEIWNNEKFINSRKVVKYGVDKVNSKTICYTCVKNINYESPGFSELKNEKKKLNK